MYFNELETPNRMCDRHIDIQSCLIGSSDAICQVLLRRVGGFWGPRVVVSTAAFHAEVQGSFPGLEV